MHNLEYVDRKSVCVSYIHKWIANCSTLRTESKATMATEFASEMPERKPTIGFVFLEIMLTIWKTTSS